MPDRNNNIDEQEIGWEFSDETDGGFFDWSGTAKAVGKMALAVAGIAGGGITGGAIAKIAETAIEVAGKGINNMAVGKMAEAVMTAVNGGINSDTVGNMAETVVNVFADNDIDSSEKIAIIIDRTADENTLGETLMSVAKAFAGSLMDILGDFGMAFNAGEDASW